ncbi:MAG: spondin domain-containing protein, partial [Myxococcota bacterium]
MRALNTGAFAALTLGLLVSSAQAESVESTKTRVVVTIENMAPQFGTFLTPVWVGFHEGRFDTYDGNQPASNDPRPGSVAMERLCEDGNNGPLSEDFAALSLGLDATIAGPNG